MVPIGVAVAFAGYAAVVWGYCLARGYNVTAGDLFKTAWPGGNTQPVGSTSGTGSGLTDGAGPATPNLIDGAA